MNPDRDGCGVIWLCPVLPHDSAHLSKAIEIVDEIAYGHGFEPQIAFIFPSERAIYMFPSIVYDRMVPGEDERAMSCHDSMLQRMMEEGYFPYRLGIHSMALLPVGRDSHDKLVSRIKDLLDPHHILAPGRYAFGENAGVASEKALLKMVGRSEHPR
jgi:4-cresol dehydrogenase (hydroxylating)